MKDNGLVSIIMLSHDNSAYVRETVESVLAQTYKNWELLFVDDNSHDDTIPQMMELKGKDKRFNILQSVYDKGEAYLRNTALKQARGRWIAFLDVGDVWAPEKLERQIAFMEENGYAFSYTKYKLINKESQERGYEISGKALVTYKDMQKCCWPGYLTVMYDAKKVGRIVIRNLKEHNDYAMWLSISEKADCHLLDETLASLRTPWGLLGKLLMTNKFKWRYEVYRIEEDLGPVKSSFYTIRNLWYGLVKWAKYVKRG